MCVFRPLLQCFGSDIAHVLHVKAGRCCSSANQCTAHVWKWRHVLVNMKAPIVDADIYMDQFVIFTNLKFNYFTHFNGPLQSTEQYHRPSASIAQGGCLGIYRSTGSLQLPYSLLWTNIAGQVALFHRWTISELSIWREAHVPNHSRITAATGCVP